MFNLLSKNKPKDHSERKNYQGSSSYIMTNDSIVSLSNDTTQLIRYYLEASPVFAATKLVVDNAASIPFVIQEGKGGEYITDDPLLKILNKPNPFMNGSLFKKTLLSYFILSGNSYINIIGNNKPVRLDIFKPQNVSIQANGRDGYPQTYDYSSSYGGVVYTRTNDMNSGKFLAPNGNEIGHLLNFNPNYCSENLYGVSEFMSCEIEINQYIQANIHNNSLLKNQATPSGILSRKGEDEISAETVIDIKDMIREELTGTHNAGRPTFLDGDFTWTQMSESIKDMDFTTSQDRMEKAAYKCVKVPLTYVSDESSTRDNKVTAKLDLYDNAVIPTFKIMAEFLNDLLMPRYTNDKNRILTYDPATIEALEPRRIETLEKRARINVETPNELRELIGREALASGGDDLRQPANMVPIGADAFTDDNRDNPTKSKEVFRELMIRQKNLDGGPLYNENQIKEALDTYHDNNKST
jgi:HK97 family phage portal protein